MKPNKTENENDSRMCVLCNVVKIFNEHREQAFITCHENCFCWDIEKIFNHTHANKEGRK